MQKVSWQLRKNQMSLVSTMFTNFRLFRGDSFPPKPTARPDAGGDGQPLQGGQPVHADGRACEAAQVSRGAQLGAAGRRPVVYRGPGQVQEATDDARASSNAAANGRRFDPTTNTVKSPGDAMIISVEVLHAETIKRL
jgi:hypothetical protein